MEKIKGQLESYKEQPFSLVLRFLMWIATFLTVGITVCIVGYILIRGIPNLSPEMFAWEYNTENVSMMPAIINTVLMVLLVLLIAVPVGIGAAIYLVEYAKRGSKLVKLVRITGNAFRNSIDRLWSVRLSVICNNIQMGLYLPGRCAYSGDYDSAFDSSNYRRSTESSTGFLS